VIVSDSYYLFGAPDELGVFDLLHRTERRLAIALLVALFVVGGLGLAEPVIQEEYQAGRHEQQTANGSESLMDENQRVKPFKGDVVGVESDVGDKSNTVAREVSRRVGE
jgi:hypothetical protein